MTKVVASSLPSSTLTTQVPADFAGIAILRSVSL